MANVKITQLDAIGGSGLADTDVFVLVDLDADTTKKINKSELVIGISDANDFVTYTLLNANVNVVSDNVTAAETRLNANIDVVQDNVAVIPSSFANAHYITTTTNSYNIGVTVASINEVDVYVGGVYQNKKEYILANSSHNVQFRDATFVAGEDIEIISRT